MKFHAFHAHRLWYPGSEKVCILGFATGRVCYEPKYRWLYSLRIFLLVFRFEILWKTHPLQ